MTRIMRNEYQPDVVTHPGDVLSELLAERGMTQVALAARTGRPIKTINEIIRGKATITSDTAIQLERILRVPASYWLNHQRLHDELMAKQRARKMLEPFTAWLKDFPVREMVRLAWIQSFSDDIEQLNELLRFFGVNSPDEWSAIWQQPRAIYRQSAAFEMNPKATAAWLRRGEIQAELMSCSEYNKADFLLALSQIRKLTAKEPKDFEDEFRDKCAQSGVAVVFVQQLKGVPLTGATRWLTPSKALIQLSLRGKWEDIMWFTFFHEAGHILNHNKSAMFIEGAGVKNQREIEADQFARDFLISPKDWEFFAKSPSYASEANIKRFAQKRGISPAIIVGRLQHEKLIPHNSLLNKMRRRLNLGEPT